MNIVKARLIKTHLQDVEMFDTWLLGKIYLIDLDSVKTALNCNPKKTFELSVVSCIENGIHSGYLPFECLEVIN